MNLSDPITVGLILLCAGTAVIVWVGFGCFMHHRRVERSRPTYSGDWSESAWGDVPNINPLFHAGGNTDASA